MRTEPTTVAPDATRDATIVSARQEVPCYHCGTVCAEQIFGRAEKSFCCQGCLTVFEILEASGLDAFYRLSDRPGIRVRETAPASGYGYLDAPEVRQRLVDFADQGTTRVSFRIPAIHCIACVWLLENLFHLKPGIGRSEVNFLRKQVHISFATDQVKLSEVVGLLASLGYEPDLRLADLDRPEQSHASRRLWMQIGVAGFAFGNIMLYSISGYLGLDVFSGPTLRSMFGWISSILAVPVLLFSAADYWKSAWFSLRQRRLSIEVPIAAGILALFGQSAVEVFAGRGDGYFDSFSGLIFFLLCGRLFQQRTHDRLAFDRDYKSFFPLSVTRMEQGREVAASLSQLEVGDRLILRNGELIPADARLLAGAAMVDYSFVTGESEPVRKVPGELLFAGGRQIGGAMEVEMVKPVSQSYLTSLWDQETFRKQKVGAFESLTNAYSQRFTKLVLAVAIGAAIFWCFRRPENAAKSFVSVLIVACPCALALAAPFTLGTAQRVLARRRVMVKNTGVIESLARVDSVIFDKTGTLTTPGAASLSFLGQPLTLQEREWVAQLARQSTHPYSQRIGEAVGSGASDATGASVRSFEEIPGCGIRGSVGGVEICLGSAAWFKTMGIDAGSPAAGEGSSVQLAFNRKARGQFSLRSGLRMEMDQLVGELAQYCELAVISGDNEKEAARLGEVLGPGVPLHFNQSPMDKLAFIRAQRQEGRCTMMVGDGLNDAGALRESDVGVAVVENFSAFSPASDVILAASMVPRLHEVLRFSRASVRIVRLSFLLSSIYNVVGVSIAARGLLSPVVCAILMPLSSATVVLFACGATAWLGRRHLRPLPSAQVALAGPERIDLADSHGLRLAQGGAL